MGHGDSPAADGSGLCLPALPVEGGLDHVGKTVARPPRDVLEQTAGIGDQLGRVACAAPLISDSQWAPRGRCDHLDHLAYGIAAAVAAVERAARGAGAEE